MTAPYITQDHKGICCSFPASYSLGDVLSAAVGLAEITENDVDVRHRETDEAVGIAHPNGSISVEANYVEAYLEG